MAFRTWQGVAALLLCSAVLPAAQSDFFDIRSINFDSVDTTYDAGAQRLAIQQPRIAMSVQRADGSIDLVGNAVLDLTAFLNLDTSAAGLASGIFDDGNLLISDGGSTTYLSASVTQISAQEVEITAGSSSFRYLVLRGSFAVTGGTLQPDFADAGDMFGLTFALSADPADFTGGFGGRSKVTLTPIPEPGTVAALGALGLLIVRRLRTRG